MRDILLTTATAVLALATGTAGATSTHDEVFANAALRELHELAFATKRYERAADDSDRLGCQGAYQNLQKAAHEALTTMHQLSFEPIDALSRVSELLRMSTPLADGCPNELVTKGGILPRFAGRAIIALRMDYAIGNADWYTEKASGNVKIKNPLGYAQSLIDQGYSWVTVLPATGGEPDWQAEMASHNVDDPSIDNSGINLRSLAVDYRKSAGDIVSWTWFYRTPQEAR